MLTEVWFFKYNPFNSDAEVFLNYFTQHSTDTFCWGFLIKPTDNPMIGPAGKPPSKFGPDKKASISYTGARCRLGGRNWIAARGSAFQ